MIVVLTIQNESGRSAGPLHREMWRLWVWLVGAVCHAALVRDLGPYLRVGILPQRDGVLDDLSTSSQQFSVLPLTPALRESFQTGKLSTLEMLQHGWALVGRGLRWNACISLRVARPPKFMGRLPSFGAIAVTGYPSSI